MKYILLTILLFSFTHADEDSVNRMQNAVDEVIELRKNYEKSVQDLSTCRNSLNKKSKDIQKVSKNEGYDYKEFEKNLEQLVQLRRANINLVKSSNKLESDLKKSKQTVKKLQDENIKLSFQIDRLKQSSQKNLHVEKSKKKTVKKKKLHVEKINKKIKPKVVKNKKAKKKKVTYKKAGTFRLNKKAKIYDKVNGKEVYTWEEKTSFTSNVFKGKWIKITGYFVNKQWQPTVKCLWVKEEDTARR